MKCKKDNLEIPPAQENGKSTIVEMDADVFIDGRAIVVFKLAPENKGATNIAHLRKELVTGFTDLFKDVAPRDLSYFEDTGKGDIRYVQRTFDRGHDGHVYETKPVGASPEKGYSQKQLDELRESYDEREHKLIVGQEWAKGLKYPKGPKV